MKKYQMILDDIMRRIESGAVKPGDKMPTEQEMTQTYGVSRITVRAATNELCARGVIARYPGKGTFFCGTVGERDDGKIKIALIILHSVNELIRIAEGIESVTNDSDVNVTMYITNGHPDHELEICRKVVADGVHGIIIFPTNEFANREFFYDLIERGFPIVFVDRSPLVNCNRIASNGEMGMRAMASHLITGGHRRIAYLTSFDFRVLQERFRGYAEAMKKHGLRPLPVVLDRSMMTVSDRADQLKNKVAELMRGKNPPTAIMCSNDIIALHTLNTLRALGISVPQTVSVSGFDNANYASKNVYSISTVEQDFFEIGRIAATTLLDRIRAKNNCLAQISVPVKLILRGSTAPLAVESIPRAPAAEILRPNGE